MNPSCAATLTRDADHWTGRFVAMASPCEVLIDQAPASLARQVLDVVASEAWRIERKFSRYRTDSAVHEINKSAGTELPVDDETSNLLDFAATLTLLGDTDLALVPVGLTMSEAHPDTDWRMWTLLLWN